MRRRFALCVAALGMVLATAGTTSAQEAPTEPAVTASHPDPGSIATTLEERLGDRAAGSYLDEKTGRLTVTVTDGTAADLVRAAGAVPRMATRSGADLRRATDELDRHARIPGTAWSVDPTTNQVVVSVDESVTGDKLTRINTVTGALGDAVRIERVNGTFTTLAGPTMEHGAAINGNGVGCTLGFNAISAAGHHVFLTAGHCTHGSRNWYADRNQTSFLGANSGGPGVYGPGGDFGIVNYQGVGIRVLPTVLGDGRRITGWSDPVVNQEIRRSGAVTNVQRGRVTRRNVTITYATGVTVGGLIQTTACGAPGDSGGPLYRTTGGFTAEALGLLSGSGGHCGGGNNAVTFYQPVSPIMQNFALTMWR